MANYVLTSLRYPLPVHCRRLSAFGYGFPQMCGFELYTVPCDTLEYPASRTHLSCEFPNASFVHLSHQRFPLAFTHLFPNAWFACIHFASLLYLVRFAETLLSAFLHTQPREFSLGFLVEILIYRGFPICFTVRHTMHSLWVPSYISRAFTVGPAKSFASDAPCIQCASRAIHLGFPFAPGVFRGCFLVFSVLAPI